MPVSPEFDKYQHQTRFFWLLIPMFWLLAFLFLRPMLSSLIHQAYLGDFQSDAESNLYRVSVQGNEFKKVLVMEKFDAAGNLTWINRHQLQADYWEEEQIAISPKQSIYVLANKKYVFKYTANGRLLWSKTIYETPQMRQIPELQDLINRQGKQPTIAEIEIRHKIPYSYIKQFDRIKVISNHKRESFITAEKYFWGSHNLVLLKLDAQGKIIWRKEELVLFSGLTIDILFYLGFCLLLWYQNKYLSKQLKKSAKITY